MIASVLVFPTQCLSQDSEKPKVKQTLHITSGSMMASQNHQYIVFSDNVNAQYGATTINADKIKVFYNDQTKNEKVNTGSVNKIIATGHVVIKYEGKTADCDKAVYVSASDSLRLTGDNVLLQSENSYVSGKQMIIYQNTGKIIVNGSDTSRVNAVFQPEEKKSLSD